MIPHNKLKCIISSDTPLTMPYFNFPHIWTLIFWYRFCLVFIFPDLKKKTCEITKIFENVTHTVSGRLQCVPTRLQELSIRDFFFIAILLIFVFHIHLFLIPSLFSLNISTRILFFFEIRSMGVNSECMYV